LRDNDWLSKQETHVSPFRLALVTIAWSSILSLLFYLAQVGLHSRHPEIQHIDTGTQYRHIYTVIYLHYDILTL